MQLTGKRKKREVREKKKGNREGKKKMQSSLGERSKDKRPTRGEKTQGTGLKGKKGRLYRKEAWGWVELFGEPENRPTRIKKENNTDIGRRPLY